METTSTTQPFMLKKVLSLIVFILVCSNSLFASPTTYASIGDFVWVDQNANGKQDSGEPGVAGVTVKLLNATTGAVVATTTTNSSGKYTFNNVNVPSCTKFRVQFGTPGQYAFTTKQAAGTTVTNNSNADANGLSDEFTMCQGDVNPCLDAGILKSAPGKATIGDFVWNDLNNNGRQDAGEPGAANVTVKLLNAAGTVVATTTTNASGIYWFTNVSVSTCEQFRVQFGTPGLYVWTLKEAAGTTVTNNSNADVNGFTDFFPVCPGDYNPCIDAGICVNCGPQPITLAQFQGSYSNGVAKLIWSTSLETSKGSYDVERSADGTNFTYLNRVNSSGISTGSTYSYNDNLPLAGNNYYRLKIYDGNNGSYQYSKIVLLNASIKGVNIKLISGNPFLNQVKVSVVSENQAIIRVTFTDHIGRVLRTQLVQGQKGSNEILVNDLGALTKGVYNLEVSTGGLSKTIKLMKD